jgi:hypothetical protein
MKTIELIGDVDERHRLQAVAPPELPTGPVRLFVVVPDAPPEEDSSGAAWMQGIAKHWSQELGDPREDIYSLNDGQPVNAAG